MTLLPPPLPHPGTPFLPKTHPTTPEVGRPPTMHAAPCATLVEKGHREAEAQRKKPETRHFEREKRRRGGSMPEEEGRAGAWGSWAVCAVSACGY